MRSSLTLPGAQRLPMTSVLVAVFGLIHLATGLALLFAPVWFFQNIGYFPPYNRHYAGDMGAFQLGLGLGLLAAAPRPARHSMLLVAVALGNLAHQLNHAYDALLIDAPLSYWLRDGGPLLLMSALLLLVAWAAWRERAAG